MNFRYLISILLSVSSVVGLVSAQGTCSVDVQLIFSRAYGACSDVERNQICYGSGKVAIVQQSEVSDISLVQDGDIAGLNNLSQISLDSPNSEQWSTAFLRLQADLPTNTQRNVQAILFGSASLTNHIESMPRLKANPRGAVNIRTAPQQDADIIDKVGVNGEVIVVGRHEDNTWLRVLVPNQDQLGWVNAEIVILDGDINSLNIVTSDDKFQQPFEHMTLISSSDQLCDGVPSSGLLLQTPSLEDSVTFNLNGSSVTVAGTMFVQAIPDEMLALHMIEGKADVSVLDEFVRLVGGTQLQIPLDSESQVVSNSSAVEPYVMNDVQHVPYLYLDRTNSTDRTAYRQSYC